MSKNVLFLSFMALWLFSSCASRKNFVYLNDMQMGEKYLIDTKYEAEVHCDDRLSILVSCKNPELAIPFNIQGGNFRVNADGSISPEAGAVKEKGYRVDALGDIDFPILGKLHVEGLKITFLTPLNALSNSFSGKISKDSPIFVLNFSSLNTTALSLYITIFALNVDE